MSTEETLLREWISSIALHNDAFREQLLACPKETLERELGLSFPPEVQLYVHEETATTIHLVLSALSSLDSSEDVSVAELEAAVTA
ncbi:MAG TPA: hypothetical protein VH593_06930 [Ktedonobacteraceae bacterium]|jgi:hypothetical protein